MQSFSVLVLVALCGAALAQPRVAQLDVAKEKECQSKYKLSDDEVLQMKSFDFQGLTRDQKYWMYCYMEKTNMVDPVTDEINVENIPFSTLEKRRECKAKTGRLLTNDHILAFVTCINGAKINVCEALKKID